MCTICGVVIWDVVKDVGYECTKCFKTVHLHCIQRIVEDCEVDSINIPIRGTSEPRFDIPHKLVKLKVYSLQACAHTGALIYPFQSCYRCEYCGQLFKTNQNTTKSCGIDRREFGQRLDECHEIIENKWQTQNIDQFGTSEEHLQRRV